MFKCVVVLFLLNTFYCSFGYPLVVNETLGKSLQLLADSCPNTFLSFQIKQHLATCNITLSADQNIKETDLECLIFYDINSQLCSEPLISKLSLNETFDAEINQVQIVDKICAGATENWRFSNLTLYPKYYNTTQMVFKTSSKCIRACGPEIVLSEDTNFYCKYYQWGSKLLQHLPTGDVVSGESGAGLVPPKTAASVQSSSTSQNSLKVQSANEEVQPENAQEGAQAQLEIPNYPADANLDAAHVQAPENNAQSNKQPKVPPSIVSKENQQSGATQASTVKNNTEKTLIAKDVATLSMPDKVMITKTKEDLGDDAGIDNDDIGSYDSGDPLEEAPKAQVGDDNDPGLEPEPKPKEDRIQHKTVESIAALDLSGAQKEIYTNTMSEQFGEVDDHFFSFFLTATILVIFFYVLYHNKSKFRKVFLGLLVEGRQPGRRRNSRGHEYRRLDTLEQAMSTNSAAPPSKIIY